MELATHICRRCQQVRPASDFSPSMVESRRWGKCLSCRREKYQQNIESERARGLVRSRSQHVRDTHYNRALVTKYGITLQDYQRLLAEQHGRCACCGVAEADRVFNSRRMHVDHDHVTGVIRGLLCHQCNIGIGALGDGANGVRTALRYLERPDTAGMSEGLLYLS